MEPVELEDPMNSKSPRGLKIYTNSSDSWANRNMRPRIVIVLECERGGSADGRLGGVCAQSIAYSKSRELRLLVSSGDVWE
jgi:hypothetical protein